MNRIAMADHERLFQQNNVKNRGPGYVILSDSQQSCCRRKSLRPRTQCQLTLESLREKSMNTVYTLSELREDVRTMIRKKIDSKDEGAYIIRKAKLLDRIGTYTYFFSMFRIPNEFLDAQPTNCSKRLPNRILNYLAYSSVQFVLSCLRRKRK